MHRDVVAAVADGVLINVGTLTESTAEAMKVAARAADEAGTPWVLDPVAAGALPWRTEVAQVGMDHVVVHDATRPDPSLAFELAHLHDSGQISQIPLGILRSVSLPTYDDMVRDQLRLAGGSADDKPARDAALQQLLRGNDTWQVHN